MHFEFEETGLEIILKNISGSFDTLHWKEPKTCLLDLRIKTLLLSAYYALECTSDTEYIVVRKDIKFFPFQLSKIHWFITNK